MSYRRTLLFAIKVSFKIKKSMRAHGWTRTYSEKDRVKFEKENENVDSRFLFINTGYNFRPLEIEGAMGIVQLGKLEKMNQNRVENRKSLLNAIKSHKNFADQLYFPEESEGMKSIWFGFVAFLRKGNKEKFLKVN
jgi:CDP-4-dehydro-6-deoxyglucose reductase, E1